MDKIFATRPSHLQTSGRLRWLDKLARLMDSKFKIPGTNFRFGLDPIMSFIPGAGDVAGVAVSGVMVAYMAKYGASRALIIRMLINVALDAIVGAIPVLGAVFDAFYKANNRNMKLMHEHYEEGKHTGKGTGLLIGTIVALFVILGVTIWLAAMVFSWIWNMAENVLTVA